MRETDLVYKVRSLCNSKSVVPMVWPPELWRKGTLQVGSPAAQCPHLHTGLRVLPVFLTGHRCPFSGRSDEEAVLGSRPLPVLNLPYTNTRGHKTHTLESLKFWALPGLRGVKSKIQKKTRGSRLGARASLGWM